LENQSSIATVRPGEHDRRQRVPDFHEHGEREERDPDGERGPHEDEPDGQPAQDPEPPDKGYAREPRHVLAPPPIPVRLGRGSPRLKEGMPVPIARRLVPSFSSENPSPRAS